MKKLLKLLKAFEANSKQRKAKVESLINKLEVPMESVPYGANMAKFNIEIEEVKE